ncbi:MAG: ABC transporter substrate-binding protein [Gammaproteobacteria bacterium]|nr:ABC transporter substrate-binding protein [Gammaproteobacteria bacterium]MBU0787616.1 ABC transporter substrate-binding protein [Gammaproteobacteria bacterium]MBU0814914.1 ABC transporter substrate-binding protein [Gammaproteobacteria bacterium]MBU1785978.1 ABC transporter substrate-binding protein [Gammaproteobacteria bacterium]
MFRTRLAAALALGALLLPGCSTTPQPQAIPTTLRVMVFPGSSNLPLLAAIEKGYFTQRGLTIEVMNTPNSDVLRAGLPAGKFEIAHAAVDNAIAMVEVAKNDAIIVMGGDAGMNEFMVRSDVRSFDDIRGKVLAVDAPNTAYALVAKKILKNKGLLEGRDYTVKAVGGTAQRSMAMARSPELAAGMVNPPFSFTVRDLGLKSLGRATDLAGPYQATGAFVMRDWARQNAGALERYISAYIEGARYAMNPVNRDEMVKLLEARFKLEPNVSAPSYDALMTPGFGLSADARFNMDGFRNVLAMRAEMEGQWGGMAPAPDKYIDLNYYDRAQAWAGRR